MSMRRGRRKKRGCFFSVLLLIGVLGIAVSIICLNGVGRRMKEKIETMGKAEKIPFQKVEISEEELGQKYYYQLLDAEEKQAYKEIVQGVEKNEGEIYVHADDAQRTNTLFQYVLKDFPEIFWCDGTTSSTTYEGEESYTVVKPVYLYDIEQIEAMKAEIAKKADECLKGMDGDYTDYEKILYVYEYIVNTVDYDLDAKDNQNIYSVFVNKRSVCAGYSKATQYLLERLGVFCTYVTGTASEGQSHAWNLVKCNGKYYYVDTTWGDPVFQQSEGEEEGQHKNISYDYMCCDDKELLKTHMPDKDVELPECISMEDNYYVVNGMYYESYDSSNALKKMNEAISKREKGVVLKFSSEELYREAHDDVFQKVIKHAVRNLAEWYQLDEVKYQYVDDAKLNKIIVYWQYE